MGAMDERWLLAAAAIVAGLLVGSAVGWVVRRTLGSPERREEIRQIARPSALFSFWFLTTGGIVVAVGILSPTSLRDLPASVLAYLPRVLVAGLILILGRALAALGSVVIGQALSRATGQRHSQITGVLRATVLSAAVVLAVAQLGVDTTFLILAVAALLFALGTAFALLVGLGGRDVARELAAGRYIRRVLRPGDAVNTGEVRGVVVAIHPATIELETTDSATLHVPYTRLLEHGFQMESSADGDRTT
jgi:MFS family permease